MKEDIMYLNAIKPERSFKMEERIKALEEVVQNLCKHIDDINEVLKMHIRYHIGDYQPINQISMQGTLENGISYTWGNYYRAEVNKKQEVQSNESV